MRSLCLFFDNAAVLNVMIRIVKYGHGTPT